MYVYCIFIHFSIKSFIKNSSDSHLGISNPRKTMTIHVQYADDAKIKFTQNF